MMYIMPSKSNKKIKVTDVPVDSYDDVLKEVNPVVQEAPPEETQNTEAPAEVAEVQDTPPQPKPKRASRKKAVVSEPEAQPEVEDTPPPPPPLMRQPSVAVRMKTQKPKKEVATEVVEAAAPPITLRVSRVAARAATFERLAAKALP